VRDALYMPALRSHWRHNPDSRLNIDALRAVGKQQRSPSLPSMRKLIETAKHWVKPIGCGRQNNRLIKTDYSKDAVSGQWGCGG